MYVLAATSLVPIGTPKPVVWAAECWLESEFAFELLEPEFEVDEVPIGTPLPVVCAALPGSEEEDGDGAAATGEVAATGWAVDDGATGGGAAGAFPAVDCTPLLWYTLSELMSQLASLNAEGLLATKAEQELALEAQELLDHVAPAQSPQVVMSKTSCRFLKWLGKSQPLKRAIGLPQLAGFGLPLVMSDGMEERGKK